MNGLTPSELSALPWRVATENDAVAITCAPPAGRTDTWVVALLPAVSDEEQDAALIDAAYIIAACNAYPYMVDALETLEMYVRQLAGDGYVEDENRMALQLIRNALVHAGALAPVPAADVDAGEAEYAAMVAAVPTAYVWKQV